jgi:phosphoglycerol transferase
MAAGIQDSTNVVPRPPLSPETTSTEDIVGSSAPTNSRRSEFLWVLGVFVFSIVAAVVVLQVWSRDLSTSLSYEWDGLWHQMIVQSTLDNAWVFATDRLGAQAGQILLDFPLTDHVQYAYYAIIALVLGQNITLAINIGYIVTFGSIAAVSFFALRQLALNRPLAASGAVLYAFLPYHLTRSTFHLPLSGYVAVPLVALVLLWQLSDRPVFHDVAEGDLQWSWRDPRGIGAVAILGLAAFTGIYYAVFAGLLLFGVAIVKHLATRSEAHLRASLALIVTLGAFLAVALLPTILYRAVEGPNPESVVRSYESVEAYALRPVDLVLPVWNHRIGAFGNFARVTSGHGNEPGQNLGLVGAFGLVVSLLAFVTAAVGRNRSKRNELVERLGLLNLLSIALGTIAGGGSLLALLGLHQIRSWNRISVYIAFFSIAAAMLLINKWTVSWRSGAVVSVAIAIVVLGIADQTSPPNTEIAAAYEDAYHADAEFFAEVESSLPQGTSVFQLPFMPFPESDTIVDMIDYDPVRGYLHTDTIRWSYGAMKGRPDSHWAKETSALPTDELLEAISAAGYGGLYIDRFGYVDRAAALESELTELLPSAIAIESPGGRLVLYSLLGKID